MKTLYEQGVTSAPFEQLFVLFLLLFTVVGILALVFYVLKCAALHDMAKTLGIKNEWRSFVPILSNAVLGRTAEGNRERKSVWGTAMVILSVFIFVLTLVSVAVGGIATVRLFFAADKAVAMGKNSVDEAAVEAMAAAVIPFIITVAAAIVHYVLQCICYYKIFKLFAPERAVVYTVFGILFNFLMPIFLFASRKDAPQNANNDGGFSLVE